MKTLIKLENTILLQCCWAHFYRACNVSNRKPPNRRKLLRTHLSLVGLQRDLIPRSWARRVWRPRLPQIMLLCVGLFSSWAHDCLSSQGFLGKQNKSLRVIALRAEASEGSKESSATNYHRSLTFWRTQRELCKLLAVGVKPSALWRDLWAISSDFSRRIMQISKSRIGFDGGVST